MEFGKVDPFTLSKIDLSLPSDDPRTWNALKTAKAKMNSRSSVRVGVGAPVWGMKDWVGKVYPKGTAAKDFLQAYAAQFNSIELNSTHYGIPDEGTIQRWREATPAGFKFNVKFLQNISHHYPLDKNHALTRQFCESVQGLDDRLGVSFLQLPPTFSIDELPSLKRFLFQIPRSFKLAMEVRHQSFFKEHKLDERYYDLLQEAEAHVVITDVAGRRDVLHTSLPSSRVLVRFVGNSYQGSGGLQPTDEARIAEWVERVRTWIELGLSQIEFFIHQPDNVYSPDLINRFIEQLNASAGTTIQTWKPVASAETDSKPKQMSLFDT